MIARRRGRAFAAENEELVSILAGVALDLLDVTEAATLDPSPWPDRPPTPEEERMVRDAVRRVFFGR